MEILPDTLRCILPFATIPPVRRHQEDFSSLGESNPRYTLPKKTDNMPLQNALDVYTTRCSIQYTGYMDIYMTYIIYTEYIYTSNMAYLILIFDVSMRQRQGAINIPCQLWGTTSTTRFSWRATYVGLLKVGTVKGQLGVPLTVYPWYLLLRYSHRVKKGCNQLTSDQFHLLVGWAEGMKSNPVIWGLFDKPLAGSLLIN